MEWSDTDKQQMTEEIAAWEDVANWTLFPKSLLKHLADAESNTKNVCKSVQHLSETVPDLYPDPSTIPLAIAELEKISADARRDMEKTSILCAYLKEHFDVLTKQVVADLAIDFLKQLKEKTADKDMDGTIAWLIEEHERNH